MPYFDCTSGHLAPNLDITMAGLLGLGLLGASSDTQSSDTKQAEITMVVMTAGLLASAVYGWKVTGACRDAKAALSARLNQPSSGPVFRDGWMGGNQDVLRPPSGAVDLSNGSPTETTSPPLAYPTPPTTVAPPPPPAANVPSTKLRAPISTPPQRPQP